jgi:hypothetical protein
MRYAIQHSVFPMPDISQAGKKEGRKLASKERLEA